MAYTIKGNGHKVLQKMYVLPILRVATDTARKGSHTSSRVLLRDTLRNAGAACHVPNAAVDAGQNKTQRLAYSPWPHPLLEA